ncbi:MAG TPA: class I SAM-dependent methyltransferase [Conexibacter sp.]|jgi:SAM-dependent methyltransferase|nr:class I SAM-dependent methyltransferase [Conexibacter sp.]
MTAVDAAVEQRPVFELFEGFALASVLASLDEAGLLTALEAGSVAAAPGGIADADGLMPAALRYLAQRELAEEREGAFALTERGRAVVKDKGYLVWLQGGYGHVLAGLGDFITGARRYGSDVERAGRWVAEGSALIGRDDVAPYAVEVLSGIEFHHVVDLGCGNARFLIGAAQRFGVTGVGVDLSPEACEDAAKMIADADLTGKVVVRCGDAGDLDAIPELAAADLAVAHFLLHEIFEHGKEALIGYLTKLGGIMPAGAHMLVAEVQPATGAHDERWRPEFTLLHAIMRQELLDADGWHEAFTAAGWSRHEVRDLGLPGAILLLYRNEKGD